MLLYVTCIRSLVVNKSVPVVYAIICVGSGDSQAAPFQCLKALLRKHTNDATQAEANAIEAHSWTADIARHYRHRAENLESICVHDGDERAVFVLLEADLELTKATFTGESPSGPQISGASQAHRTAMNRYAHLHVNSLKRRKTSKYVQVRSVYCSILHPWPCLGRPSNS